VLAKDTWTAKKGRDALSVEWDESGAFKLGTDEMQARYQALAKNPGLVARKDGDAPPALAAAAKHHQAPATTSPTWPTPPWSR
jgi:isoquinoline 1-oxidoreductase beta subunit